MAWWISATPSEAENQAASGPSVWAGELHNTPARSGQSLEDILYCGPAQKLTGLIAMRDGALARLVQLELAGLSLAPNQRLLEHFAMDDNGVYLVDATQIAPACGLRTTAVELAVAGLYRDLYLYHWPDLSTDDWLQRARSDLAQSHRLIVAAITSSPTRSWMPAKPQAALLSVRGPRLTNGS